jgi:excisionase family DNA binding protein
VTDEPLLTTDGLAAWLGCSRDTVYALRAQGLPVLRLGTGQRARLRFEKAAVGAWLSRSNSLEEKRPARTHDPFCEREYVMPTHGGRHHGRAR